MRNIVVAASAVAAGVAIPQTVTVNSTGEAAQTLLTAQVPAASYNDGVSYDLGVRIVADVAGQFTAVRFWKSADETGPGPHVGRIWTASGQIVATVTFTNETASGWQQQALVSPVAVQANTEYLVTVNTQNYYPDTQSAFVAGLVNGHLQAPAGPNGVFGAVGTFPTSSYQSSNYFRDVVFVAGSTPPDMQPPVLTNLQPANGATVNGLVPVSVTATDDAGVVGVQFQVDGANLGSEDQTAPYSTTWNSASVSNGMHTVMATARDAAGVDASATVTVIVANGQTGAAPPIPELANWQSHMTYYGALHCNAGAIAGAVGSTGVQSEDNVWYYDGTKVYQQIAAYTQDPSWYTCAGYTNTAYRGFVLAAPSSYHLGGWRVFPHGLAKDYQRTGDTSSRAAAVRLANESAFAWSGGDPGCGLARETAYVLHAYLVAEELGEPRHPQFATAVDNALIQLHQSLVTKECDVAPFMMGLTMESLIHYYERTSDPRVPPAIETAADAMWTWLWHSASESFVYTNLDLNDVAPDLNLLIAPAYAWLWQLTGAQRQLDRGDAIFAGGVRRAWLGAGKAFSQNYRSSFDYVKWRSQLPGSIQPLTRY
jgi:hypothetical protein